MSSASAYAIRSALNRTSNTLSAVVNGHTSSSLSNAKTGTSHLIKTLPRPLTNTLIKRPIPNSYWATPSLVACEYPFSPSSPRPKLDALLAAGVRAFVDLTEPGELLHYSHHLRARALSMGMSPSEASAIEYHRFPIPDRSLPHSQEFVIKIMDLLRELTERKSQKVAVHCRGGIGRTGIVVGCWLVESGAAKDGEEALRMIAQEWKTVDKCRRFPNSPETGPQVEFVRNFVGSSSAGAGNLMTKRPSLRNHSLREPGW